ncbi:acylphosphatase [Halomarina oriensis]|uniref:acylphosphatase n=1 Tax=Halomarina oriensis TaxID=671145 RepID=A0A6B0GMG7_9EURY|nr:acylphosphatase [Halomarina oriensis]
MSDETETSDGDRTDERTRRHVFVSGRVQGVTYRASTRRAANERGVDGWVRNLDDGRVEAVFEGPAAAVTSLVEWCHDGPSRARVEDVTTESEPVESLDGFEVRR